MSERIAAVIHDGQADAMPCQCPVCASPFIKNKHRRGRIVLDAGKVRVEAIADQCRSPVVLA